MILSEVRDYLRRRGQATLTEIAAHFDAEPDAVRAMLDVWLRKGKIHRARLTDACGTRCHQCEGAEFELYLWDSQTPVSPRTAQHCEHD